MAVTEDFCNSTAFVIFRNSKFIILRADIYFNFGDRYRHYLQDNNVFAGRSKDGSSKAVAEIPV